MQPIGADPHHRDVVVVGASAGGVDALPRLVAHLSSGFPAALLIVQHLMPSSQGRLVEIVQRATALPVSWGEHHRPISIGEVVIAPPGRHMRVDGARILLDGGADRPSPSVDVLFRSAAEHHRDRVVGVLLTGTLQDGVAGLDAIDHTGGAVVVQDPSEAEFADMPRAALAQVTVDHVAPLDVMAPLLEQLCREPLPAASPPALHVAPSAETPAHAMPRFDPDTERALWAAVRSLQQQASSYARLARDARMTGSSAAPQYERHSTETYAAAIRARHFLLDRQRRRHRIGPLSPTRRSAHPGARAASRGRRA